MKKFTKKFLATVLAICLVLSLTACGKQPTGTVTGDEIVERKSFAPIEITGDNVLNSVRVFDTMYEDNEQAMFSPLSLNMCLGMLEAGAAGSSKEALDAYLANSDYARFASDYLKHAKEFNSSVKNDFQKYSNVFEVANSLWVSNKKPFNEDYKKKVAADFAAEIDTVDFSNAPKTAKVINDWVNEKTHKMIPTIVREEQLTSDTAAVVVNTVYFESAWREEWRVPAEKETFTNLDGTVTQLELMRNSGNSYFENKNATAFSCNYKNGMKFIGILPKKQGDFTLESLDIGSLLESETGKYDVNARMPKLNFQSNFPLTDALIAAGLSDIFDPEKADFTPMQGSDYEQFYISEVLQKTKLELDEEGTRAAAVTAAFVTDNAMMPMDKEEKDVFLDRPFAFLIYDGVAEQIVFMGKVTQLAAGD